MHEHNDTILIIGGGGHALVVADAVLASGLAVCGFLDDDRNAPLGQSHRRVGGLSLLDSQELLAKHPPILGVGDVALRRRLVSGMPDRSATVIHPAAWVSPGSTIGAGVYIGPLAIIHTNARISDHATVNSGAVVEHGCVVGVNSHIAPNATLGGDVRVGDDTLIGLGATILPGVRIGDHCTIGAGSAVIHDLNPNTTAVGVPAAILNDS